MPDALVRPDNFARAESDLYLGNIVKKGGFGEYVHYYGQLAEILNIPAMTVPTGESFALAQAKRYKNFHSP